ncbi:ArsC/Spx/MgsR family protein [Rhodanobacter koreensis]
MEYRSLGLDDPALDDVALIAAIVAYPKLIERPIAGAGHTLIHHESTTRSRLKGGFLLSHREGWINPDRVKTHRHPSMRETVRDARAAAPDRA